MKTFFALALSCWASLSFAQNEAKFTLNGTITDTATGETLIGVTVRSDSGTGTVSNEYGFYSLTLPAGVHRFSFVYLGYVTATQDIALRQNQKLDIALRDNSTILREVEVKAEKRDERIGQE